MKQKKILLDFQATSDLLQMLEEVKEGSLFVQLTPSKLVSWIVSRYRERFFCREKVSIRKAHFNHKKHLREALKSVNSEDELKDALSDVMRKVGRRKRQERNKK